MALEELKKDYVRDLLKKGKRGDERDFLEYRSIRIEKNFVPNAEGSAMAFLGDTKVLAGIKFDLIEPYKDKPEEGTFIVNAEFSPMAHPDFNPGPPNENSIELARIVDRALRSAEVVDLKKLFLEEGKALGIYIDIYVLDYCGNLIDCSTIAAMSALTCTRVPKYENGEIVRTESRGRLELARTVSSCTFEKIGEHTLLDATEEEEIASDGRLTIATCDGDLICAGQKSGSAGFKVEEIMNLVDVSIEKGKFLRKKILESD